MDFNKEFYFGIMDDVYIRILKLRKARKSLGISQPKMAELMNITTQKLIRIENYKSKIFLEDYLTYKKIIEAISQNQLDNNNQK